MNTRPLPHRPTLANEAQELVDTSIAAVLAAKMTEVARAGFGGELPPALDWSARFHDDGRVAKVIGAVPADVHEHALPRILTAWANALHFTPTQVTDGGELRYTGVVDGLVVTLWGITDREEWSLAQTISTDSRVER